MVCAFPEREALQIAREELDSAVHKCDVTKGEKAEVHHGNEVQGCRCHGEGEAANGTWHSDELVSDEYEGVLRPWPEAVGTMRLREKQRATAPVPSAASHAQLPPLLVSALGLLATGSLIAFALRQDWKRRWQRREREAQVHDAAQSSWTIEQWLAESRSEGEVVTQTVHRGYSDGKGAEESLINILRSAPPGVETFAALAFNCQQSLPKSNASVAWSRDEVCHFSAIAFGKPVRLL